MHNNLHDDLLARLIYIADKAEIKIENIEGNSADPDVAFCKSRIINLNNNFECNISVAFRLAHEISHIQFSQPTFLYTFSPFIKNKEERETNERAIRMIAKLIYNEVPNERRNWANFMSEFNLPNWFEPLVKELIYD
ncbi:hypothetical protein [Pediococcus pentosaceus]|jgi:hypothetical protein|uniref:hypothetical protein n=1 Tax=Pediococcus pentosaceus TaxID=1255 RepID=UPI001E631235|nr:hypothetical protein [Pediococcus pentosaceus]MCG7198039.1 hypothetical protein [Pediococcus pentosaceus]MCI2397710.1 hypothetical protein [Pediococcus pentosaceus]